MNDLERIKELEKITGVKLTQIPLTDLDKEIENSYVADENGTVVGLDLKQPGLAELPGLILKFSHLKKLSIADIKIKYLSTLGGFRFLVDLTLRNTKTHDFSPIKYFENLTRLSLRNNKLHEGTFLSSLGHLTKLDLSLNQLTDLSCIAGLTLLRELDLSYNQVKDLAFLDKLSALASLDLRYNQVDDVSRLLKLENLTELDLRNNKICILPANFLYQGMEIKWEWDVNGGIFLEGNPLETPPIEIVKKGKMAIASYFKSLEGEKRALNEVKVLLVGEGGSGKTSLMKRLIGENFDKAEPQTHGINIKPWKVKVGKSQVIVRFWDFGGQEIMHATHQFFLSKRSLYILVLDCRKDERTEYWLKHIRSFGGDSPVLVVINKIDENPAFDVNRSFLTEKYSNIKGFFRVSCAQRTGIDDLAGTLGDALLQVELLHTTWAESWFNIKNYLENMKTPFISLEEYKKICEDKNIGIPQNRDILLDFLHDLGVVMHFKDYELEDTHVLEPRWVTEAVYKIINSAELVKNKGVLNLELLEKILEKNKSRDYLYPKNKHGFIIKLMKKFELCYELDPGNVLVPDLLEVQQPSFTWENTEALQFIMEYDFFPRTIMPRFIVAMHLDIKHGLRWRTGVVLEDQAFKATAVVKADYDAKRIYIDVTGQQKRDYFAVLLAAFRRINRTFERLTVTEKIPMPDDPGITADYDQLIRMEQRGIEVYLPGNSDKEYKIGDLLGTLIPGNRKDYSEEDLLKLLRKIKAENDTPQTLFKKAHDIFIFQPTFMGMGIDVKKLIEKIFKRK